MSTVHPIEMRRLGELETVIEAGLVTFVEVGKSLAEIRDSRLYRAGHTTFEAYCQERWQWGRDYADNLIKASAVSQRLADHGQQTPPSERQARPLTKLPPEKQPEAWDRANEKAVAADKPVTAATVEAAVAEVKALETYEFMRREKWPDYRIMEAATHLDALPDVERPRAASLIGQKGIPAGDACEMLTNLRNSEAQHRERIYRLHESDDPRDRSLAITTVSEMPPMPDERIAELKAIDQRIGSLVKLSVGDEAEGLRVIRKSIRDFLSAISTRKQAA